MMSVTKVDGEEVRRAFREECVCAMNGYYELSGPEDSIATVLGL